MGLVRNLKLRYRGYACTYHAIRFATRLRGDLSEFALSMHETIEYLGDELAVMARDACIDERERRWLLEGMMAGLRALELPLATQMHIRARLEPRIIAGEPLHLSKDSWQRIAV